MIITEFELRANWHKNKAKVITVPPGSVITPSARDFLRSKGITVQIEGNGVMDFNKNTFSSSVQSATVPFDTKISTEEPITNPALLNKEKPEYMTHLRHEVLVKKTHPVIALRGQNDLFQCCVINTQYYFSEINERELVDQLEEILNFVRGVMSAEVKNEPFHFDKLLGLGPEELREQSHHPHKYFGVKHASLDYQEGPVVAKLHMLRSKARELELYANRAFLGENGECVRADLVQALNRLSSALYIMICRVRSRSQSRDEVLNKVTQEEMLVPIGISNRHIHLAQEDLETLFGKGYRLSLQKELSQPGQFAAKECVILSGPKGQIENVRVLGPLRKQTQIEVSTTDCYKLGINPVIRDSGQIEGTEGLKVFGPAGALELAEGAMVAGRHIHISPDQAQRWNLTDGSRVTVEVTGLRPVLFKEVLIRVSPNYSLELHLDTDEGNAACLNNSTPARIVGVQHG